MEALLTLLTLVVVCVFFTRMFLNTVIPGRTMRPRSGGGGGGFGLVARAMWATAVGTIRAIVWVLRWVLSPAFRASVRMGSTQVQRAAERAQRRRFERQMQDRQASEMRFSMPVDDLRGSCDDRDDPDGLEELWRRS